jgi:hypothetical protein
MSALPPQKFLTLTAAPKSSFLSLAPATSPSYPKKQTVTRSHTRAENIPSATQQQEIPRRRSSATGSGYRILKLGPVHWGEHSGAHKEDFHDVIMS